MNYWEHEEISAKSQRGKRNSELFLCAGIIPYCDIEAISMYLLDVYMVDGKLRTDRIVPSGTQQRAFADQLNDSDNTAIIRLAKYKHELEIRFNAEIPLTDYQAQWVSYILGHTNVKPALPEAQPRALQEINEGAEVPF